MLRGDVFATGVTGSSGSGNEPSKTTHHPERATNFRSYKCLKHQHTLEVENFLATLTDEAFMVRFMPQSGPFVRGIYTTVFPPGVGRKKLESILREAYDEEPLISVGEESPDLRLVQGTALSSIGVSGDSDQGVIMVAIDNLGKGGASQAVQNLNCMLELEDATGLRGLPGGFI